MRERIKTVIKSVTTIVRNVFNAECGRDKTYGWVLCNRTIDNDDDDDDVRSKASSILVEHLSSEARRWHWACIHWLCERSSPSEHFWISSHHE
jgi:hypothetical protein